jgi:hypothetical protein
MSKPRDSDRKPPRGHNPKGKLSRLPWPYCLKCGLLYLHNEMTRRAVNAPCPGDDDR